MTPTASMPQAPQPADALSRMFGWWNGAICDPQGFTEDAFRQHFTEDAQLIVNGSVSAQGIAALTAHFRRIQARVDAVEIELPFRECFSTGDRIFTYHFIRSHIGGELQVLRAMGYAVVRDDKLALVHLTRAAAES